MHKFVVLALTIEAVLSCLLCALSVSLPGNLRVISPDVVIANGLVDGIYWAAVNAGCGGNLRSSHQLTKILIILV